MRLSKISKQRGVPYQNILTEFLLERFLVRLLIESELANSFIFKGGYVGRRVYGSPRYTVDLDALIKGRAINSRRDMIIGAAEKDCEDGAWYRFAGTIDLETQGEYPGLRFEFRSGLGKPLEDLTRAQILHFDIGVGDAVKPLEQQLDPLLAGDSLSWSVYPREVIVAEKLHSFLSRPLENSRSKDLFDLLFHLPNCRADTLRDAVAQTFVARGDPLPKAPATEFRNIRTVNLKRGWVSATSSVRDVASFDKVFSEVIAYLEGIFE